MRQDAGDRFSQAKAIGISVETKRYRDRIGGNDLGDVYRFRLKQRSSLDVRLTNLKANVDLELYQDLNRNGQADLGESVASSRASDRQIDAIAIEGLATGTYFLRVLPKAGSTRYRLSLAAKPTSRTSFAYEIVQRTNAFRRENGLPALALNTQLTQAAQKYAEAMATQDFFSHTGADGTSPWDRIRAADYDYSEAAENLAAGHIDSASAMQGWINSPGHRANLLAKQVQEIGVGYFYNARDGGRVRYGHYWAQSMGTPANVAGAGDNDGGFDPDSENQNIDSFLEGLLDR